MTSENQIGISVAIEVGYVNARITVCSENLHVICGESVGTAPKDVCMRTNYERHYEIKISVTVQISGEHPSEISVLAYLGNALVGITGQGKQVDVLPIQMLEWLRTEDDSLHSVLGVTVRTSVEYL